MTPSKCPDFSPQPALTDGEASNPGPISAIASLNLTSVTKHDEEVRKLNSHVTCVQETKLTDKGQLQLSRLEAFKGWGIVFGAPIAHSRDAKGVAIFTRPGVTIRIIPPQRQAGRELWDTARFCHAAVAFDGCVVHIVSVYGYTNAAVNQQARQDNEAFMAKMFAYLATFGDVPVLIGGDMNIDPVKSAALRAAFSTGRWREAAELQKMIDGLQMQNTCFAHETSVGSRIDSIIVSHGLSQTFRAFQVIEDKQIPVHRILRAEFELSLAQQEGWKYFTPQAFPSKSEWEDPDPDAEAYQGWDATTHVLMETQAEWEEAMQSQDSTRMLNCFSRSSESYLSLRALGEAKPPKRMSGRGAASLRKHTTHAPQYDDGGALDTRTRSLLKLTRRVEELV